MKKSFLTLIVLTYIVASCGNNQADEHLYEDGSHEHGEGTHEHEGETHEHDDTHHHQEEFDVNTERALHRPTVTIMAPKRISTNRI